MNTIPEEPKTGRRRRRLHSDDFKAEAVAACSQPGVSMAAVALSRGINANLLRRWVRDAEAPTSRSSSVAMTRKTDPMPAPERLPFVPVTMPAREGAPVIRVELRRGAMSIIVSWPVDAATDCATWMRELLR